MSKSDYLIGDILSGGGDDLETTHLPTPRAFRFDARRRLERVRHAETLAQILGGLPGRGESIHVVSGSKFDFWTVVPFLARLLAIQDTKAALATQREMNRLLNLYDSEAARPADRTAELEGAHRQIALARAHLAGAGVGRPDDPLHELCRLAAAICQRSAVSGQQPAARIAHER